jgi:hypothetical protein
MRLNKKDASPLSKASRQQEEKNLVADVRKVDSSVVVS